MDRYSSGSIIGWIIGIILFCIFEPVIYFGLCLFWWLDYADVYWHYNYKRIKLDV